jgi:hypothetical protein
MATNRKWCFDSAREEAKKYDSVTAFKHGSSGAFGFAERKGILKQITAHYPPKGSRRKYTEEYVAELAAPFDNIKDFKEAHPVAYCKASEHGFLLRVTAHMTRERKPSGYWNIKQNVADKARQFKTRWDWDRGHQTSYNAASRNGWLDDPEVTGHMPSKRKEQEREPASPDMQFGSAVQMHRNADRMRLAKSTLINLLKYGKPQFRYTVAELINKTSPNYRKNIARCSSEERDQVFRELHDACVIRVDALGDVLNPKVDPTTNKFVASESNEMYLITNPEMPGWVKGGQSVDPERRARDMKTGAPADYNVEHRFELPKWLKDTDIHPYLEMVAGAKNREWFYMPVDVAAQVVRLALVGEEKEIRRMPKCPKPSQKLLLCNSLREGLRISRKLKAQQVEVLYDAEFLAFS